MPRQQSQLLVMQLVPCIARTEELLHLLDLAHLSPQLNPPDVERPSLGQDVLLDRKVSEINTPMTVAGFLLLFISGEHKPSS